MTWDNCPPNCAYCNDPDYGHPKPHSAHQPVTELEKDLQEKLRLANESIISLSKHAAHLLTQNDELRDTIESQRKTVIRLLRVSNSDETIDGACLNRMQEVLTLRGNYESLEREFQLLRQAAKQQPLKTRQLKQALMSHIDTSIANDRAAAERGY